MSAPGPAATVVIICYNDADRLADAIRSVQRQSREDIEIVVVDHGSDDDSVAVAESAAAEDPRIHVVALREHRGKPGVPINAGIAAATAPWVVVMGSDDVMRRRGCETLLRVAGESDADIVVAGVRRVDMDTRDAVRWMPGVTLRSRIVTDVLQFPELIRDTIGGFKLYRKQFLVDNGLSFPEDIFYQDQVFTIGCYAAARTVAIASRFVGDWRHWHSGQRKSVTQRKTTAENLADRFEANRRIDAFLLEHGREDLLLVKHRKFLTHDLSVHVKDLAAAPQDYGELLVSLTRDYTDSMPDTVYDGIPLSKWLMVRCLRACRLEDAERVANSHYVQMLTEWDRIADGGRSFLVPPWLSAQPDPVFDITRFRIDETPDRLRPARGWVTLTPRGRRLRCRVVISSPGRRDRDDPVAGELQLRDPVSGTTLVVPLGRAERLDELRRAWQVDVSLRSLDRAIGVGEELLELYAVFHDGEPDKWSVRLRAGAGQQDFPDDGPDWLPRVDDHEIVLVRTPRQGWREAVAARTQRFRPPEPQQPDPWEELSLEQARDYLSDHPAGRQSSGVFLESFMGRRIGGGPFAVSRRLAELRPRVPQRWACNDFAMPEVPRHAQPAPRLTRRYIDLLAASAVWIDDGRLPFDPDGRMLVQLWHGMPLSPPEPPEEPVGWTHLVTSGDIFTARLQEAYGSRAELLPVGAPRTDPLVGAEAAARRARLRAAWGIADRTVVLFLPALRPGQVSPDYRRPDVYQIAHALGPDYFWLHREHDDDLTGRRMGGPEEDLRWFAGTLSSRTDLADYLLMADILVSDYSSAIVDFGWTGRAVIHYAPDADFFESVAPGTFTSLRDLRAGAVVAGDAWLIEEIKAQSGTVPSGESRGFSEALAPLDASVSAERLIRLLEL